MRTMTDALIRRLNAVCATIKDGCEDDCVGWCDACWRGLGEPWTSKA